MNRFKKKILAAIVLSSLFCFYFVSPLSVKKADAFLGISDITFNTTIGDIPQYIYNTGVTIAKFYLEKLRKRMVTQLQNDLVNWVQGGGKPRFITNPGDFIEGEAKRAAASTIDKFFLDQGVDICEPFKANLRFLVDRVTFLQQEQVRCTLGDIKDNLEDFAQNFENGGWTAWVRLHETRNTLPGAYLASTQIIGADTSRAGNTAQAKISAGKGFLDQKKCSSAAYKVFDLEFEETDGATTIIKSENMPPGAITKLLDPGFNAWTELWPEISKDTKIEDVITSTIHLVPTGETITTPIDPPGDVPPGATCAKEETVTPGSIIGDQISGTLKSTGIDKLINAQEIGQILDAVIDAAVNRVAREGLSYMKSGRGSYTAPFKDRGTTKRSPQQMDGIESTGAVSLQNQLTDLRTAAEKLKRDTIKLTGGTSDLEKFNMRLNAIAGRLGPDGNYANYIDGVVGQTRLRTKDSDKKFSDVMDRMFYKANSALQDENSDGKILSGSGFNIVLGTVQFSDGSDFNKESNVPGLYLANKALNQKMADLWQAISSVFQNLSATTYASCKDIDYTLEPAIVENSDQLPFMDTDGKTVGWASNNHSYVTNIKEAFKDSPSVSTENLRSFAIQEMNTAAAKSEEHRQLADSYDILAESVKETVEGLSDDLNFATSTFPQVSMYSSLLIDYDRAGKKYDVVKKTKIYNEMLGGKNKELRVPQTDGSDLILLGHEALEKAYDDLLIARRDTETEWLSAQKTLAEKEDNKETGRENKKLKTIKEAIRKIDESFVEIDDSLGVNAAGAKISDPTQTGLKVSDAVAEAMGIDADAITSELQDRQVRIGKLQTDISNRLGKFIAEAEQRKQVGLEGGDSEWEKHFKNRFQLIYSAFIYDFYKNRLNNEFGLCGQQR